MSELENDKMVQTGSDQLGSEHAHSDHDHDEDHGHLSSEAEISLAGACGLFLLVGWITQMVTGQLVPVALVLYLVSYAAGGFGTLLEVWRALKEFKFEIDLLMLVAAVGAAALGEWAEGALLLFLFSAAHALEHLAMGRAKKAIESLADLAPKNATLKVGQETRIVPVESLKVGDIVIVKPNSRIAADGFVVAGSSNVDQSPITGESIPVGKKAVADPAAAAAEPESLTAENRVFAGTINDNGSLEIYVTRITGDSTLSRVVKMVKEAKGKRSPTQNFTRRFESIFVPAVLLTVFLLLFAPLVINEPFEQSFYRAMALLVGASPCALAISTPSAVLSGVARAARSGVLVKGGGPLESLGHVAAIAFDKTGTLTEGKPRLTDAIAFEGSSEPELLQTALAVEQLSDHPLATAVTTDGSQRLAQQGVGVPAAASDIQNVVGKGIKARIDAQPVFVGKANAAAEMTGLPLSLENQRIVDELAGAGRTTILVTRDNRPLGVLGVMDTPRDAASSVMRKLKAAGVQKLVMISGDNQSVADAVGKIVGIDQAYGDLLPEDKVQMVAKLQESGGVAMIGDGVNDAPAMAKSTVGIAMGAAGSDVALETADIALMADDLTRLPFAVALSRQTASTIRQNVWISLGMVSLLVPLTILGLPMALAVVLHEGSTIVVVLNALRLLAFPDVVRH